MLNSKGQIKYNTISSQPIKKSIAQILFQQLNFKRALFNFIFGILQLKV